MGAGGKALRAVRTYWPLLAIPPIAAILNLILVLVGTPWTASEWASNIVFAYIVTVATVLLSRRQAQLQESVASTELIEKIAAVTGALDALRANCEASVAQQILIDARAGLHLLRYADEASRREYLETLRMAAGRLSDLVTGSVRPYTYWRPAEWVVLQQAIGRLAEELDAQVPDRADRESKGYLELRELLGELRLVNKAGDEVPFEPFEKSFSKGEVGQRIRAQLNWELLRRHIESGRARITVHRAWSIAWLDSYEVFSVWYTTVEKVFAAYDAAGVRPIRFSDIDDYFGALSEQSRATIESMADSLQLRPHAILPQVEIVTVRLSRDQLLVIDGNHRVAAIRRGRPHRAGPIPATIVEYRIDAPLDPELLPDLAHHQRVGTPA